MAQFYIVNSKAKSVRTDLALELLKQLTERDPEMLNALTERGKDWRVHAQQVVRELSESSPVWRRPNSLLLPWRKAKPRCHRHRW